MVMVVVVARSQKSIKLCMIPSMFTTCGISLFKIYWKIERLYDGPLPTMLLACHIGDALWCSNNGPVFELIMRFMLYAF